MHKRYLIAFSALLALTATGCGESESNASKAKEDAAAPAVAEEKDYREMTPEEADAHFRSGTATKSPPKTW